MSAFAKLSRFLQKYTMFFIGKSAAPSLAESFSLKGGFCFLKILFKI
jgi:hypothetical protein